MAKKVITVLREQICHILVDVPDDWTDVRTYCLDADELCDGLLGLDWEEVGEYQVDNVRPATDETLDEISAETSVE